MTAFLLAALDMAGTTVDEGGLESVDALVTSDTVAASRPALSVCLAGRSGGISVSAAHHVACGSAVFAAHGRLSLARSRYSSSGLRP